MTAKEALKLSIESVKDEIEKIDSLILAASAAGDTSLLLVNISEAAIQYFIREPNFYQIDTEATLLNDGSTKIVKCTISWHNANN